MTRTTLTIIIAFCTLVLAGVMIAQPSLSPPAGPIDESGRFGSRIELSQQTAPGNARAIFRITEPGSYYLTGDVEGGTRIGVMIASDNVTLDLNGYTINGRFGNAIQGDRDVTEDSVFKNLFVRNGRITGYDTGIQGRFTNSAGFASELVSAVFQDLNITGVATGIEANVARIERCTVEATLTGIETMRSVINDCHVTMVDSDETGFVIGIRATSSNTSGCFVDTFDAPTGANVFGYAINFGTIYDSFATGQGRGFECSNSGLASGCASSNFDPDTVNGSFITVDSTF